MGVLLFEVIGVCFGSISPEVVELCPARIKLAQRLDLLSQRLVPSGLGSYLNSYAVINHSIPSVISV